MSDKFADCAREIVRAFELEWRDVESDDPDLFSMVFALCSIVECQRVGFFGEILAKLAVRFSSDSSRFYSELSCLGDQLELGLEYKRNPRSLNDVSKITGRDLVDLIGSLSTDQRKVLCAWQELAIEKVAERWVGGSQEEVEKMTEIHAWFLEPSMALTDATAVVASPVDSV